MRYLIIALFALSAVGHAADESPVATRPAELQILTAANGLSLYVFDRDVGGVPSCYNGCATVWPALITTQTDLKTPLGTAARTDGQLQVTYQGKPVYFYNKDKNPGDTLGDGIQGTWHLVTVPGNS
jgi:predicted lipoprotein with Yx(FWY)xxD motif